MTGATGGSAPITIGYDPLDRIRQTVTGPSGSQATTQFLYDGVNLIAEYDGTSGALLRRYVHGAGTDEPLVWYEGATLDATTRRWLHADHQGSVIAWSDSSGSTAGHTYTYGPYGEPQDWQGSRFRYTGQIALPEAQVYHYKARAYDPIMGRFLQTDPIGQQDDPNLYAYVKDDPVDRSDPTGLTGCADASGQGVGGGACVDASNFKPGKSDGQTVVNTPGMDKAMVAAAPSLQTTSNDRPQEKAAAFSQNADGSSTATSVKTVTKEVGNTYESKISGIPAGTKGIEHSHPNDTSTLKPGPKDNVAVSKGLTNGVTNNGRVGVIEKSDGQYRFRALSGVLSSGDVKAIQGALNDFQRQDQ
jgi:RHS repeat-associated protein